MDKYHAWISALTPLNFANEKSIEQIVYELIPLALEIKDKQDTYPNLFNEFLVDLGKKLTVIITSISDNVEMFTTLVDSIRLKINTKESDITNDVTNGFNAMLNLINNFGDTYFTKNPEVFNNGINKVNFDITNFNSCYHQFAGVHNKAELRTDKFLGLFNKDVSYGVKTTKYWYNLDDKQIYYGDNIATYNEYGLKLGEVQKCDNKLIYHDVEISLGDNLFPHTENGYFIGFPDVNTACYFAKTISDTETKYALKMINLSTKEITTYENLVMPSNFKDMYLLNNSHYLIKKFNDYYYLLYCTEGGNVAYIAKSNDLINWGSVGTLTVGSECTLKVIKNSLYFVSISNGTWLFNETDNSFTRLKVNNYDFLAMGEVDEKYCAVFLIGNYQNAFLSTSNDFTENIELGNSSYDAISLEFANVGDKFYIITGVASNFLRFSSSYIQLGAYDYNYRSFYDLSTQQKCIFYTDKMIITGNGYNEIYGQHIPEPVHLTNYGDFVINENGDIYSDFNLQKVSFKHEWRSIGT